MSVETEVRPTPPKPKDQDYDEVMHLRCCEPERAMCGYDLSGAVCVERSPERLVCIVCEDFDEHGCPRCGQ